jgi:molecular chaperone DnaK (HSP70)
MALPWGEPDHAVGVMARDRGAELPGRLVSSAKSWLSYAGVDRTAPILPFRARGEEAGEDADVPRVSPVTASSRYLSHLAAAFEAATDEALADQDVLVTVPASFDAVARELTAVAAREAGLPNITLLEEPQAAFYAWLDRAGDSWRAKLHPGDVALVCDVGGGTSDFSLIEVSDDGAGNLVLERVAVGDHILLGGDNMDLTLAHVLRQRLAEKKGAGKKLSSKQLRALVHACRRGKETLLGTDPPAKVPITILGGGSKLIGKTIKTELERGDVESLIGEGFFPRVDAGDRPAERKAIGLRELGLPYATDPAVTRHLAAFLGDHERRPTAILYNGGVMQAPALRERIAATLGSWYGGELRTLGAESLDLAVAHGAAYYGLVRAGRGIRIRGGTARAYYIGVESSMPAIPGFEPPVSALCVAPAGMEEGSSVELPDHELGFVVGEPSTFRFFASSVRKDDAPGDILDPDSDDLSELAPVEANLAAAEGDAGRLIPVTLSAQVTEVGTLELWGEAKTGEGRWKLEYSVRGEE